MEIEGCILPDDLLYDLELDVWARPLAEAGTLEFGLMAPLASFAGRFLAFRFRDVEAPLRRGQSLATAESVRYTGAVRVPTDVAEVLARNPRLATRPKLLNDEGYAEGWVARLRLPPGAALPSTLETADGVRARVRAQIEERHVRCYPAIPDLELFEIGSECSAVFARLDDELELRAKGDVALLVADDPTAPIEMERWLRQTGHLLLGRWREENLYRFLVRKEGTGRLKPRTRDGAAASS